jgi:hypothetical protein
MEMVTSVKIVLIDGSMVCGMERWRMKFGLLLEVIYGILFDFWQGFLAGKMKKKAFEMQKRLKLLASSFEIHSNSLQIFTKLRYFLRFPNISQTTLPQQKQHVSP